MLRKNRIKLFIPGPVNLSSDILSIGSKILPYYRDPDFAKMTMEIEEKFLKIVGCKDGRLIPYLSSGTGAMDSVMTSIVSKTDKILVINGGSFGKRWEIMCEFYDYQYNTMEIEFGKPIDINLLETALKEGYNVILMQHDETDSGQLYDIKKIGYLIKQYNAFLVVDAISSFLTDHYDMDEYNVDVTVLSTQKGLMLPVGGSFLVLNQRAITKAKERTGPKSFYFDINTYLEENNLGRGYVPYTPNVTITYQLYERLKNLDVDKEIERVKNNALTFRDAVKDLPLKLVAENPSNFLSGYIITDTNKTADNLYYYLKKYNIFITKPGKKISTIGTNYIRITHFGLDKEDYIELAKKMRVFFQK